MAANATVKVALGFVPPSAAIPDADHPGLLRAGPRASAPYARRGLEHQDAWEPLPFFCECDSEGCFLPVWLTRPDYPGTLWTPPFFHPAPGVLAYSENLLGTAPLYWLLRPACQPVPAYQLWTMLVTALTYASLAWVLRRLGIGHLLCGLGGFLFALMAAITQAVGILTQRPALAHLSPDELCLVRTATASVLLLFAGLWSPAPRRLTKLVADRSAFVPAVAAALIGTWVGLQLLAYGIAHAEAGVVGALTSLTPLFSLPIGWWSGRERFGRLAVFGTLVSVAGVVALSLGR